eukprot:scaffold476904_cov47-Prasinocladus_malaysianus.AAC.1
MTEPFDVLAILAIDGDVYCAKYIKCRSRLGLAFPGCVGVPSRTDFMPTLPLRMAASNHLLYLFQQDLAQSITANFELNKELAENTLGSVMSSPAITVTMDTPINELHQFFQNMTGLPVVNADGQLLGVVSKKDLSKNDGSGCVRDIMSSPPVAAKPDFKVA